MQPLCTSHDWPCSGVLCRSWLDCGKSLLHTKLGSHHVFFAAMLHSLLCPTLWPLCPKTGSVLAMQPLCRSHGWTVVNHYYTQNWGLTMCFLRQCCTTMCSLRQCCTLFVPHIVVTMLQNWLGLGHAAFVQKSWLDCGKSLLHTKLGSHHAFFAAMLHSQFVPHIVATVLQNWLVFGHAAFVSSPCVFCGNAALTVCAPHCGHMCPKAGSVLAMQVLWRSHGWTVVNHYYTQNRGLTMCSLRQCLDCGKSLLHTKLGSNHVFFAAMLHSQFVPHIVATVPQNWLGIGHAGFVEKSWLDCGKSLLHTKLGSHCLCPTLWSQCSPCVFCGNAALTVCAPHCGHNAPKLARSWPCSLCAEVMIGLW